MDIYSSPSGQGVERDLASTDARRFTQIESMSLTRHSFKSSKPLKDILRGVVVLSFLLICFLLEPYRI